MNIHRRNWILAALALALAVPLWLDARRGARETRPSPALFPGFDAARATRILVEAPSTASGAGAATELRLREGRWIVPSQLDFPAREEAVLRLLGGIANAGRDELVSERPEAGAVYGVGAEGRRIAVHNGTGAIVADFVQGNTAGAGATYVRPAGEDSIFRIADLPEAPADPAAWLDRRFVRLAPSDVARLLVERSGNRLELTREPDGTWTGAPSSPTSPPSPTVEEFLSTVCSLRHEAILAEEAAAVFSLSALSDGGVLVVRLEGSAGVADLRIATDARKRESPSGASVGGPSAGPAGSVHAATDRAWERPWVVALPTASVAKLDAAARELMQR